MPVSYRHHILPMKPYKATPKPIRTDYTVRPQKEAIMAILVHAAERGLPCPTNLGVAEALGNYSCDSFVKTTIQRYETNGLISIERTAQKSRKITITATGQSTAWTKRAFKGRETRATREARDARLNAA